MTTNTKLTSRQRKVVTALLSCGSVPKAAVASGISERSIYRYLADDEFQQALLAAESDAINQATRRLLGLQDKAVGILEGIMDDDEASDSVRLRAATNVLDYLVELTQDPTLTWLYHFENEAERLNKLLEEIEEEIEEEKQEQAKPPKRGTLGDVAQKAGVPYQFAKEAQAHGLISPDGKQGDKLRYRYKLASWLEKLHMLNLSGYSWGELRAWSKRRFKTGHEHERKYPAGFKELTAEKNAK